MIKNSYANKPVTICLFQVGNGYIKQYLEECFVNYIYMVSHMFPCKGKINVYVKKNNFYSYNIHNIPI